MIETEEVMIGSGRAGLAAALLSNAMALILGTKATAAAKKGG